MAGKESKKKKKKSKKRHQRPKAESDATQQTVKKKQRHEPKESSSNQKDKSSLASRLKRFRGTAESTPLPPEWSLGHVCSKRFLTPSDKEFKSCHEECYHGFYWEAPVKHITSAFDEVLEALEGLFLHDAVQAGGKKVSRTYVTRTLIGKPGSTYRYLGLRLFSHPWSTSEKDTEVSCSSLVRLGYSDSVAKALIQMGQLNTLLSEKTKQALGRIEPMEGPVGSADYTLTLVNKMEPTLEKRDLKPEKVYGMGKTSVSWHKDSGLMDFSSIAVYHSLRPLSTPRGTTPNKEREPWRVALRVSDTNTRTPPLSVPLESGSIYYLLDDFNHKHEHAVLAGSHQVRYSSTHRVAREGQGTWQYISEKCEKVVSVLLDLEATSKKQLVKATRAQQQLLTEIEFEWLRQWHVQGERHAQLHPYWHKPMEQLQSWFQALQQASLETMKWLSRDSKQRSHDTVSEDLYDVMIESFEERAKRRTAWSERLKDPLYASLPVDMRPFACPVLEDQPTDLKPEIGRLRKWRTMFVDRGSNNNKTTAVNNNSAVNKNSGLTRKEKRKVASNWEMMQASMKKDSRKGKQK